MVRRLTLFVLMVTPRNFAVLMTNLGGPGDGDARDRIGQKHAIEGSSPVSGARGRDFHLYNRIGTYIEVL